MSDGERSLCQVARRLREDYNTLIQHLDYIGRILNFQLCIFRFMIIGSNAYNATICLAKSSIVQ